MEDGARALTIAVIGAGPLGRRLALAFAQAGLRVIMEDVMPANLRQAEMELAQLDHGAENLSFATSSEAAVREADIAIDFVPDELESKLEIFCLLDRMAPPRTILCTPSRAMSITDLASCTYRAERCVAVRGDAGHELAVADAETVRILRGPATLDATVARVQEIFQQIGKLTSVLDDPDAPVLVKNAHLVRG
jgi:3-hydroxybutyryl-CoA dehydrogenase